MAGTKESLITQIRLKLFDKGHSMQTCIEQTKKYRRKSIPELKAKLKEIYEKQDKWAGI